MKNVRIYQLKNFEECGYAFASYDYAVEHGFSANDYECVYDCKRDNDYSADKCFEEFNMNIPNDFKGHSLSVGDVVMISGKCYFCNDCGWVKLDKKMNTLFDLEKFIADNYKPMVAIFNGNELKFEKLNKLDYLAMKDIVDGYIEYVYLPTFSKKNIDIIVNEEGKLIGLDTNLVVLDEDYNCIETLQGNLLFVNYIGNGENDGLTEEQIDYIKFVFENSGFAINDNLEIKKSIGYDDLELINKFGEEKAYA